MKFLVVLAALVACAAAKPGFAYSTGYPLAGHLGGYYGALGYGAYPGLTTYAAPAVTYAAPAAAIVGATKTQYHAQDELGQVSHGYAYPGQAAAETRDAAGNVRGSYAYINPEGREIRTNYVADHLGFRAESNALPVAPAATVVGPAPVLDTPEVAHAKAVHFAAVAEAQARAGRKKRGVLALAAPVATSYGYATTTVHAAAPAYTYAAAPAYAYAGAPALTYAAAPAYSYGLRPATLTTIHNNPGHAVSYRVD